MKGFYCLLLLLLYCNLSYAQTITSAQGGSWHLGSTWVGGVPPTATNSVEIDLGHKITIEDGTQAEVVNISFIGNALNSDLTINNGGSLTFTGTCTLGTGIGSSRGRLTVNGTLIVPQGAIIAGGVSTPGRLTVGSTGIYRHAYTTTAGTIYPASWATGATLEITGYTTNMDGPSGLGQAFSNVIWHCENQMSDIYLNGSLANVSGNLTFSAPATGLAIGLTLDNAFLLTVGGKLTIGANLYLDLAGGTGNAVIIVKGDFEMLGDGGVAHSGTGSAEIQFGGSSPQKYVNEFNTEYPVNFRVKNGSVLNVAANSSINGPGNFTLEAGGTLGVASVEGLVVGQSSGAIRVTGSRDYQANGNIVYNGTTSQLLGNEWGATGVLRNAAVNLEIANTSAEGVTNDVIGGASLIGRLTLTSGSLNIGESNILEIQSHFSGNGGRIKGLPTSNLLFSGSGNVNGTLDFDPSGATLNSLVIDRVSDFVLGSNVTIGVGGQLEFASSGNIDIGGQTLTINGDIIQTGSGGLISDASSSLFIGGVGVLTSLPFCTDCGINELQNLTLSRGSGGTYTWNNTVTIRGDLTLNTGTFTHESGLTMGTGSTFIKAGGTFAGPSPGAETSYNVRYTTTSTTGSELPGDATSLGDLTISGAVSLSKPITVNGSFLVTTSTLTTNSHTITMNGPTWSVSLEGFSAGTGTVVFSRAGGTTLGGTSVFHNVTITAGSSITLPSGTTSIGGTIDIDGTINPGLSTVRFDGTANTITGDGTASFNHINITGSLTAPLNMNVGGTFTLGGTFTAGDETTVTFTGTNCSIAGNPSFNHIVVSGTLNGPPTLTVKGNLTINGTFSAGASTNVVLFDGPVHQTLGRATGSATTITLNNITVDKTRGTFSIAPAVSGTVFALRGVFRLQKNGQENPDVDFDGPGNPSNPPFKLLSTANTTARIASIPSGATVVGNISVERYVANASSALAWRYFSSPVIGATVADWKETIPVIGHFSDPTTGAGVFNPHAPSIYVYEETLGGEMDSRWAPYPNDTQPYDQPASSFALENGKGYSVFIRDDGTPKLTVKGSVQTGDKVVNVTSTGAAPDAGYNLIGNPYPSPVNWSLVGRSGEVSPIIYLRDNVGNGGLVGTYLVYDGSEPDGGNTSGLFNGIIASGQAFFVETSGPGTVTFTESSKSTQGNPLVVREGYASRLKIRLDGNGYADEALIRIRDGATEGYDFGVDARKLANDYADLYTFFKGKSVPLAINSIGQVECAKTINVGLKKVTPGNHTLSFSDMAGFLENYKVMLVDNFVGESIDLKSSDLYGFDVTADTASYGDSRFKLVLMQQEINLDLPIKAGDVCSNSDALITIENAERNVEYFASINGTVVTETVAGAGNSLNMVIASNKLAAGDQTVSVMARRSGCAPVPMAQNVILSVKSMLEPKVTSAIVCGPGSVSISASGAPSDNGYRWYNSLDAIDPIAGVFGEALTIPELSKSKTYYVSIVNELGCEGPRVPVEAQVNYQDPVTITVLDDYTLQSNHTTGNQWFLNGKKIDGADGQLFKPDGSGTYSVEVASGPCSTSAAFLITGAEEDLHTLISTYPNPVDDEFVVEIPSGIPARVSLLDALSKSVSDIQLEDDGRRQVGRYNMRDKPSGLYILSVSRGQLVSKFKIIKK